MSRVGLERALPHAIDAEKALLGAVLVNNENFSAMTERLVPEDLYLDAHRTIFRAIVDLMEMERAADLVTLQDVLIRDSKLEPSGGPAYLASLLDGIPHLLNVDGYIDIIKEKSGLRQLIRVANRIMAEAFDGVDTGVMIIDRAQQHILELSQGQIRSGFQSLAQMQPTAQMMIERLYQERELITGVASGYVDIDRLTSGFQAGDLVIVAARPAMGKTAFGLNIAAHAAFRTGLQVGMFSLEMTRYQLLMRMLCAEAMVDAHKLRTGYLSSDDFTRLISALHTTMSRGMHIDDSSSLTIMEMRAKCRRLQAEHGLDLVIVDYLQLMRGYEKTENRTQEISAISRGLKALAKELNVPVLSLAQLSRAPEQRTGDHRPMLSDLRESGSIEQDADTVMFLYREEVYKPDDTNAGFAEVIISKQRNGPVGVAKLAFLKQFTKFENLFEGTPGGMW